MEICQPPRKVTRRPILSVPALSCDCHSHIIGPESRFPASTGRTFVAPDASEEEYAHMLGQLGVERMIVVQPSFYGTDNTRLVTAVARLGTDRCRGVAMVTPDVSEDVLRYLDAAGMRAARFITTAGGGPSLDGLDAVARRVAPYGWHVEMYVPQATLEQILPRLARLPVPVVLDHMAGLQADTPEANPALLDAVLELMLKGQAWTKLVPYRASLAGTPYSDVTPLARRFLAAAPDQCVWGSDWPHTAIDGYMPDDGDLLDLMLDWTTDEELRHRILVRNPARLYRF